MLYGIAVLFAVNGDDLKRTPVRGIIKDSELRGGTCMAFCQVIVDIAHEDVDRVFTYRVPKGMDVCPGMRVHVPSAGRAALRASSWKWRRNASCRRSG